MTHTPVPRRWRVSPPPSAQQLAALGSIPALAARVLWQRGLRTAAEVEDFLHIDWRSRHDPFLLQDMDKAQARVQQAIAKRERIVVYGDFDTDGVTAVTLLMQLFQALNVDVHPYIPLRAGEGYGLNRDAISKLQSDGADLLITVDCGISNAAEIAYANELGLDVVVLDHHQPPAHLPPALAVVDPKRSDCAYPFKGLCGVGLAFKLFEALWKQGTRPKSLTARDLLDVVALGTIADMMPLSGENRVLVHYGLQAMRETQRPGLLALCRVASVEQASIDAQKVAFRLAPRINAAGRLEDALLAYHLLLAPDAATAQRYAEELNSTNVERQALMRSVQTAARELALERGQHEQKIMVVAGENFHHGVVGLAAGRLAEEFYRPVLVMGQEDAMCRGSARSVPGFNIVEALQACADLLEKYGGHAAAAGFTVAASNLPAFEARLQALANERISDDMLIPHLDIDTEARFSEINWESYEALEAMAPFGIDNPQPLLCSREVRVLEARPVGGDGQHLKLRLQQGGDMFNGISFGNGMLGAQLERGRVIDVAYVPEVNVWRNQRSLELRVVDIQL